MKFYCRIKKSCIVYYDKYEKNIKNLLNRNNIPCMQQLCLGIEIIIDYYYFYIPKASEENHRYLLSLLGES